MAPHLPEPKPQDEPIAYSSKRHQDLHVALLARVSKLNLKFPVAEIARRTGLAKSNISEFLNGKKEPSENFLNKFSEAFPEPENKSKSTKEKATAAELPGIIMRNPHARTNASDLVADVPYYDADFAAGKGIAFFEDNVDRPAYTMQIPGFAGCVAFSSYGDSMEKLIRSGSILFGRKLEDWQSHLEYGQIYGIVMKDGFRYLKYIRKSKTSPKACFLLKSENAEYDDFEIPKDKIHSIWLIEGWMLKRT